MLFRWFLMTRKGSSWGWCAKSLDATRPGMMGRSWMLVSWRATAKIVRDFTLWETTSLHLRWVRKFKRTPIDWLDLRICKPTLESSEDATITLEWWDNTHLPMPDRHVLDWTSAHCPHTVHESKWVAYASVSLTISIPDCVRLLEKWLLLQGCSLPWFLLFRCKRVIR